MPIELALKALEYAIKEMKAGAGEIGENNSGPFIEKYLNGLCEPPANWCSAFISWCFSEASKELNIQMPFKYNLSAKSMFNEFKKMGQIKLITPEPGNIIFFWREDPKGWMGHVGIVKEILVDQLKCIEGNKGIFPSKVKIYTYNIKDYNYQNSISQFLGFGYLK